MDKLLEFLSNNGTKLVGYVTVALGFIAVADPALIGDTLGGNWQKWALLISGVLTAVRGHQSTAAEKASASKTPASGQAGFARIALMAILALGSLTAVSQLTGCSHTREAYGAAETLEERAYVVSAHYTALVEQAASLRTRGILAGAELRKVQEIESAAAPVVGRLPALVAALKGAQSADNELALQAALDDAVRLIADLVRALKGGAA